MKPIEQNEIIIDSPYELMEESNGFKNEIRLVKTAIDTMVRRGKVTPQVWDMALKTLAMLEKLEREERQERTRRENSELARLKHELALKKENTINLDEYHEQLKLIQNAIEKFVPKEKLADFGRYFDSMVWDLKHRKLL